MANIIREDIVKISFDIDKKGLTAVDSDIDKLKKSVTGDMNSGINKMSQGFTKLNKSVSAVGKNKGLDKLKKNITDVKNDFTGSEKSAKGFKNALQNIGKTSVSNVKTGLKTIKTNLQSGISKAGLFVASLKNIDGTSLKTISAKIDTITRKLGSGLVSAAKLAGRALAALGAAGVGGAVMGVNYNSQMETYQTSFEVMTGSAKKAVGITNKLQKMGASTPFEMTDLAETTQLLMNYGLTADDAMSRMSMLGDISQGNADKMNRIAMAYGQMSSAGKVQLEDVKQMIEAGFNPLQEISSTTGESMASLYDRISKGKISVDEITASMKRSTSQGGKYYKSMEKQSKTFSGQLSTLKDNAQQFLGTLTKGIFAKLSKTIMPRLNNALSKLSDAFEKGGLKGLFKELGSVGKAFQKIVDKINEVRKSSKKMKNFNKVWQSLKKVLNTVIDLAGDLVTKFIDFATSETTLNAIKDVLDGINSALKWCKNNWETVETAIFGVVGAIAGLKLGNFINDLTNALFKVGLLKTELTGLQKLSIGVGVTLAITGIVLETKGIAETITEGLDFNNFAEILGGGGLLTIGGALIGHAIAAIGAALGAAIAAIPAGIGALFAGIWDACKNGIDWLSGLLIGAGATALGAGIGGIIGSLGGPIGAGIGALIGLAVGLVTDLVILIVQKWDVICAWFSDMCSKIGTFFKNLWSNICESPVGEWINTKIIQPVKNFFIGLWDSIKNGAITAWNSICQFFSTIASWINTNIIQPVKNFFLNFFYFLVGLAVVIWEGIKAIITPIASWVNTNIIQPVKNFFISLWTSITTIARNIWTSICSIWGLISSWVYNNVILPVINFFKNLWTSITTIVRNVWTSICTIWGIVASWVNSNVVQPIINFFRNLWTSITTIVRNVWNTICSVWGKIASWVNSNIIEPIKNFFSGLWTSITETVASVKEAITGAFQAAYDKVTEIWSGITGFFSKIWDGIKNTVNKLISKGKEALGVESDVKSKDGKGTKHAWGGLMTTPHWGQVAEDGAEMIIPLSKDKRNRGLSLWQQTGKILGVGNTETTKIDIASRLPSYSPESTSNTYFNRTENVEHNTYAPQLSFTISGTNDDRVLARKIKRAVQEAMTDVIDGVSRNSPKIIEV